MTIHNILEKINDLWDTFMESVTQGESTQMTWRDVGTFLEDVSGLIFMIDIYVQYINISKF